MARKGGCKAPRTHLRQLRQGCHHDWRRDGNKSTLYLESIMSQSSILALTAYGLSNIVRALEAKASPTGHDPLEEARYLLGLLKQAGVNAPKN